MPGAGSESPVTTPSGTLAEIPGHESLVRDMSPKEDERLMPGETLVRSYLAVFGGLAPLEAQTILKGRTTDGLFDAWTDYLTVLGIPDPRTDILRGTQSNPLMLASFERIGVALCDRSVERDLKANPPLSAADRTLFTFDTPEKLDREAFETRFNVLHRTFLGYPVRLAPTDRTTRFFALYQNTLRARTAALSNSGDASAEAGAASVFSPREAAWAVVCHGLVRHPEFHLY